MLGGADLGVQPHVIECVLNHAGGFRSGVTSVYNRSPYANEVRAALALWEDYICALVDGSERKVDLRSVHRWRYLRTPER